jgi:hypothetical protein
VILMIAVGIAAYTVQNMGSATPASDSGISKVQTSNFLGYSSTASSGSDSTVQSVARSTVSQYPLVWGTTPPVTCEGEGGFCLTKIYVGFAGQNATNTSSVTTMIQGIWATVVNSSTTTLTNAITIFPPVNNTGTSIVAIYAYVQDAVTGQNATRPDGDGPVLGNSCNLQPTGLTDCGVDAPFGLSVPSGDHYKVTLFVTSQYEPCSLRPAGSLCASTLLASPLTFIISE